MNQETMLVNLKTLLPASIFLELTDSLAAWHVEESALDATRNDTDEYTEQAQATFEYAQDSFSEILESFSYRSNAVHRNS